MRYLLRDLFRDVIDMAKAAGVWHMLTVKRKEDLVVFLLREYSAAAGENKTGDREPILRKLRSLKRSADRVERWKSAGGLKNEVELLGV